MQVVVVVVVYFLFSFVVCATFWALQETELFGIFFGMIAAFLMGWLILPVWIGVALHDYFDRNDIS